MTNYNDGKWHGWNGGECPVHPETIVIAQHGSRETLAAKYFNWKPEGDFDIIAFRVIKEHKEPREFWAYFDKDIQRWCFSDNKMTATHRHLVSGMTGDVMHLREVLE